MTGATQGMGTSGVFYNAGKWGVEKTTIQEMKAKTNGEFGITAKVDYHDDGLTMFDFKYLELYITTIVKNYKVLYHIDINKSKSRVVANTTNQSIKTLIISITIDINDKTKSIKTNFEDNIFFVVFRMDKKNLYVKK